MFWKCKWEPILHLQSVDTTLKHPLSHNKDVQTADVERRLEICLESVYLWGPQLWLRVWNPNKCTVRVHGTHKRARYSFLGTFVMMGLGRILKINLRLMRAVTEYEVLLGSWSMVSTVPCGSPRGFLGLPSTWPGCLVSTAKGFSSLICFPNRMWCPTISTGTPWWMEEGNKHVQKLNKCVRNPEKSCANPNLTAGQF